MGSTLNGLSKYNPLSILNKGYPDKPCNQYLDIFILSDRDIIYDMDICQLLHERNLLCEIYTKIKTSTKDFANLFYEKFLELIEMLVSEDGELFWDYFYVLQEIVCKVSSVSTCRQAIVSNLDKIQIIIDKALAKERSMSALNGKDYIGYSLMSCFIINKFKQNSDADDDELATAVIKKLYGNSVPPFPILELISLYKNCSKFDMTLTDILEEYEFCLKQDVDYFWIYLPYLSKYLTVMEDKIIKSLGEDLYDYWLRMLITQKHPDYSKALQCKEMFDSSGVLTYGSKSILDKLRMMQVN